MRYEDIAVLNQNIYLSKGNLKLKPNDDTYFLIFSLPAIMTCHYATEMCKQKCYARKAERLYRSVLESRIRNLVESEKDTFVEDMIQHIEYHLQEADGKTIFFRWHESGDFWSKEYYKKCAEISNHFKDENILFQAYTKSLDFIDINDNIHFVYSVWDDTESKEIKKALKLNLQLFYACDEIPNEAFACEYECGACKECYTGDTKLIAVKIH